VDCFPPCYYHQTAGRTVHVYTQGHVGKQFREGLVEWVPCGISCIQPALSVYGYKPPVRKTLGFWPTLPVAIRYSRATYCRSVTSQDEDSVISAFKQPDRICNDGMGKFGLIMQVLFPTLECLRLGSRGPSRWFPGWIYPTKFI